MDRTGGVCKRDASGRKQRGRIPESELGFLRKGLDFPRISETPEGLRDIKMIANAKMPYYAHGEL
jgi:hypothetical protein